jgi:outer membrane protein assembly factor BamB
MRRALTLAALLALAAPALAADWPQWLGPNRDANWTETGLVEKFPGGGPKVLWRKSLGGGYAGPAVGGGKVYVTDRALAKGEKEDDNPFKPSNSKGQERVTCFDAATGKRLWQFAYDCRYRIQYPAGPRATPVVHKGKVYTLGAMGDLYCLDAEKGTKLWHVDFKKAYKASPQEWGFSAHPLIDGDRLICLVGRDPAVVAFDKDTGKEKWKALTADSGAGYCPPVIYTFGKRRDLVIWHPAAVVGLDPATGQERWSHEWDIQAGLSVSMPRQVGSNRLFLTSFYNSSRLLEVTGGDRPEVKLVWRNKGRSEQPKDTDGLHSIIPTPYVKGGHVYGVCSYGELRCLDLKDGKRKWTDLTATGIGGKRERWANAFLIANGERFFLFNEKGDLIIAKLTPEGYKEIDKAHILDPTGELASGRFTKPRLVLWSHPAFAGKVMYARNDKEIVAVSLAK